MSFDSIVTGPHDLPAADALAKICRRLAYTDTEEATADLNESGQNDLLPSSDDNDVAFEFYVPPGSPARASISLTITDQRWTLNEFGSTGTTPVTITDYGNWDDAYAAMNTAAASGNPVALVAPPTSTQSRLLGLMSWPDSIGTGPHDLPGASGTVVICRRLAYPDGESFGPVSGVSDYKQNVQPASLNESGLDGRLPGTQNNSQIEFYISPNSPARAGVTLTIAKQRWTLNEFGASGTTPASTTEFANWGDAYDAFIAADDAAAPVALVAPPGVSQAIRLGLAAEQLGRFLPKDALKVAHDSHLADCDAAAASLNHS